MKIYLIKYAGKDAQGEDLWWRFGADGGWVFMGEDLTVFTQDERDTLELPEGGKWIEFNSVVDK